MKKAVIIGATGFGGLGLIEILLKHPNITINQLIARKDTGKKINEIFPHLSGYIDLIIEDLDELNYNNIDIAFFSTPDQVGMKIIKKFYELNIPVIDFSGDFRFTDPEEYKIYAANKGMNTNHDSENILKNSVYGLPELNKDLIKKSKIIGNPGCFAISMILGLLPAISENLITADTIICDGKTAVSGAGKNPGEANFYPQRYENINTYREGRHQHIVEVQNIINKIGKKNKSIFFVPQIVPMTRGILTTIYANFTEKISNIDLIEIYKKYYADSPFVCITDKSPQTADVRGSNYCLIRPLFDKKTNTLFITTVIDNLLKGQSGNAVQIANIIFNFPEKTGLDFPALYP